MNKESLSMIALFYLNYWVDNEEEKESFKKILNENEKKYQEELKEKYNPDNLFKNKNLDSNGQTDTENINFNQVNINENLPMIIHKNFFRKILDKIKSFLKK